MTSENNITPPGEGGPWLSGLEQIAGHCGLSVRHLRDLALHTSIPGLVKRSGRYLIRRTDLDAWLLRHQVEPQPLRPHVDAQLVDWDEADMHGRIIPPDETK